MWKIYNQLSYFIHRSVLLLVLVSITPGSEKWSQYCQECSFSNDHLRLALKVSHGYPANEISWGENSSMNSKWVKSFQASNWLKGSCWVIHISSPALQSIWQVSGLCRFTSVLHIIWKLEASHLSSWTVDTRWFNDLMLILAASRINKVVCLAVFQSLWLSILCPLWWRPCFSKDWLDSPLEMGWGTWPFRGA